MRHVVRSRGGNHLLDLLPESSWQRIAAELEFVELPKDFVLAKLGDAIDAAYFPISGIGSVIVRTNDGVRAEAGMIGNEGFLAPAALGGKARWPYDASMCLPGQGYRIDAELLNDLLDDDRVIERILVRFSLAFTSQIAFTALANASYPVDVRLARWLLMCHDRTDSDEINIVHDYIAAMLNVRRASITSALHKLEGDHLIKSVRGIVHIVDRNTLEAFAGASYGSPEQRFLTLLGTPDKHQKGDAITAH